MKKIQNYYLYSYRMVGFIFLTGLIASIIWYGFSILFFIGNSSWSVPMVLSPNQEKVMAHLEHVLSFEHEVTKNRAELIALEQTLEHKKMLRKMNRKLAVRVAESMSLESTHYDEASHYFDDLSKEKSVTLNQLNQLSAEISEQEDVIDNELKAGLITKNEAILAHITWNKVRDGIIDSKASMYELHKRSTEYAAAAHTLNGTGNSLKTMNKVIKKVELEGNIAQLTSDIFSLKITQGHLQKNITKKTKVLSLMKNSPYIMATRKPVTVAFVPYTNLKKIKVGSPTYSCYLDMVLCYKSGVVVGIYNAEEYTKHPIFKSDIKGQLIGVEFTYESDAQKKLLFLNSKPLLI